MFTFTYLLTQFIVATTTAAADVAVSMYLYMYVYASEYCCVKWKCHNCCNNLCTRQQSLLLLFPLCLLFCCCCCTNKITTARDMLLLLLSYIFSFCIQVFLCVNFLNAATNKLTQKDIHKCFCTVANISFHSIICTHFYYYFC